MKWLVSYSYKAVFKDQKGNMTVHEENDVIELWNKHPVIAVADMKAELSELLNNPVTDPMPARADEITIIHSVIEISDELLASLSEEQLEALEI